MESIKWMAWTWPTALFFGAILSALLIMTFWSLKAPQKPRKGILGIATTPGDRLFVSLLGSAFIYLFWLALTSISAWGAGIVCIIYFILVFRYV